MLAFCAEQELLSKEHPFPREVCWGSTKAVWIFFFKLEVPAKYCHQGLGEEGREGKKYMKSGVHLEEQEVCLGE